jgi:hypothetical protein
MNEQLQKWLEGNPIHGDECCPDFSCCRGIENMAPKETRERFCKAVAEGDDATKFEMLGVFLGAAISNAYVAGLNTEGQDQ